MSNIHYEASFFAASHSLANLPESKAPEIAILGRSNVGKSTLLNRIVARKKLARTSSTPGRTKEICLYQVSERRTSTDSRELILADLPGFGYAKFSKKKRTSLARLTVEYLSERENLVGVLLLNDCRREPKEDELAVQNLCFERELPITIVLTKCDKLSKNELQKRRSLVAAAYGLEPQDIVTTGLKEDVSTIWDRMFCIVP